MKLQKSGGNIPTGPSPQLKPSNAHLQGVCHDKEEPTQLPADGDVAPELITKKVLAKRYSVSTRTVQNWVTRRIIPFIRISGGLGRGLLLFNPKACDAALNKLRVKELPVGWTRPRRKPLTKPAPKRATSQAARQQLT